MEKSMIIRTIVLAVALVNQTLVMFGWSPIPFESPEIEYGLTIVFTVIASIVAWWKNNSITKEARQADKYMRELKNKKRTSAQK